MKVRYVSLSIDGAPPIELMITPESCETVTGRGLFDLFRRLVDGTWFATEVRLILQLAHARPRATPAILRMESELGLTPTFPRPDDEARAFAENVIAKFGLSTAAMVALRLVAAALDGVDPAEAEMTIGDKAAPTPEPAPASD